MPARATARTVPPTLDDCRLLSVRTVAATLALSDESVYRLIRAGTLRAVVVKGKRRIRLTDLHAYVSRLT